MWIPPDLGKESVRRFERKLQEEELRRTQDRPWERLNNPLLRRRVRLIDAVILALLTFALIAALLSFFPDPLPAP